MLTIFCGDNTFESRNKFNQHVHSLKSQSTECIEVPPDAMRNLDALVHGTASLFADNRVFVLENVCSKKDQRETLMNLFAHSDTHAVIWESKMDSRNMKRYFPKSRVVISNIPTSLWTFLDNVRPGNSTKLINDLTALMSSIDEHMVLYMLQRRIKDLILVKSDLDGNRKLASWQKSKLLAQAQSWNKQPLERLYVKLFDIETGVKTSELPYSPKSALDILLMFYIQ